MRNAYNVFVDGIARTHSVNAVYNHLIGIRGLAKDDVSDLLRLQIVHAVSAFDRFMHELVRIGVLEIFSEHRKPTNKFNNQSFKAITLINAVKFSRSGFIPQSPSENPETLIDEEMTKILGYQAFQAPDKVKDALSYIWNEPNKMRVLALKMGLTGRTDSDKEEKLTQTLKLISDRRNQIVHEADYDSAIGQPRAIDETMSNDSINFIKQLGWAIYEMVTDANCYLP